MFEFERNTYYDVDEFIEFNQEWKNEEIICPYCKEENELEPDNLYKERDEEEFVCQNCGRKFNLTSGYEWWYTTTPIVEEVEKIKKEGESYVKN